MTICILDTSVLCELLDVPNKSSDATGFGAELKAKVKAGEKLLLPMAAVFETGNHVGQNGDGTTRRKTARRFVDFVGDAIRGQLPFTTTPIPDPQSIVEWLDKFPDWAARSDEKGKGSGLGDLSIKQEWDRQRELHPRRRVYIWSLDQHLSSYDYEP